MMKTKLTKYRFIVGICGPNVLHTNIFKAETPEKAARMYLESTEQECTDEKIAELVKNARIVEDIEREGDFTDALKNPIAEGDEVAFVYHTDQYHLQIGLGSVSRFTKAKVFAKTADGKEYGMLADEFFQVNKVVKMEAPIEPSKNSDDLKDALERKIEIGDEVVYLGSFNAGKYDNYFSYGGEVTAINKDFVAGSEMDGHKKKANSFVIIRKAE